MGRARAPGGGAYESRPASRDLRELLIVAAATVACLLPFVDKAFHIDDHRYVEMAQQIHRDPLDYFGFSVNLGGSEQPEAAVSNNPPLVSFFAAAAALVTGWSELGLHLAFLLPALGATLATWGLARRLSRDPLLAALIVLSCPVFLVSATTVMADVSMTALFCGSLWFWIRGLERRSQGALLAGACLAALCALTKYFGISLIPLLLAWSLARERRLGAWSLYLLVPLGALVVYELYTHQLYGVSPILSAMGYSVTTRTAGTGALERALVAVVFAGGALASLLFFAAIGFSRRMLVVTVGVGAAVLAACLVHGRLAGVEFSGPSGIDANFVVHVAIFATAGSALFVLIAADLAQERDSDALLLALWALGAFAFATVVNYTTNGRALLPLTPPLAILMARQIGRRHPGGRLATPWRYAPLAPALTLALAVVWGDAALADASRVAARRIGEAHADSGRTLWFEGSWGFQHYMKRVGGRPVDVRRNMLRPGDLLAGSDNTMPALQMSPRAATVVDAFELPLPPVTTMLRQTGTGFYAIQWGPLPYRFLAGAGERFEVRRLDHLVIFEPDPEEIERRLGELHRAASFLAAPLALRTRGWPAPELPEGAARGAVLATWSRCEADFERLAAALSDHCLWCASVEDCAACADSEAERAGLDRRCTELLFAAARERVLRCESMPGAATTASPDAPGSGADATDRFCREALRIRRELTGERDP